MSADAPTGRAERAAINLARHLNERHPDTVLFLARFAGGQRDAASSELLAVDDAGVTLRTAGSERQVRIGFDPAAGQPPDARGRLRQLLLATRSAHPEAPMTSLEETAHCRSSTEA
jgi:hypothetical protein